MILTIWRHGEAGEASEDYLRELTGSGEDDVAFACHQFNTACEARELPHPEKILHSPWIRTTQTADIIAGAFSHASMSVAEALQPGGSVPAVEDALTELCSAARTPEHILLVSHQPLISHLLAHYLGESGSVPGLAPGGLATLLLEAPAVGCGSLLFWGLPPEYEMGL